tara:strand:+ start:113063 stop:114070 length:1008 start_codon:yes stop_codon:yes gene_type:complete
MDTKLNRSDYILLIVFSVVSSALNIIEYYNKGESLIEYFIDIPASIIFGLTCLFVFVYFIIPSFLVKEKKYFHFAFYGILILIICGGLEWFSGFLSGGGNWEKLPNTTNIILNSIFIGSNSVGFPLGLLLTKKFYESQSQISNIQQKQKENELKLLRSQIDPHFLFNNLNTLDSLIDSDSEKAKEYINRLSLIYRYLIRTKDAEVMELSEEIQFAENYVFLIETRFGDDYKFKIEKETNIFDKFIPTGALQALLENVVKHNKPNGKPVQTSINIKDDWLTVSNTKSAKPNKESLGTGLQNLQTRYELLSDKKVDIKNANTRFVVSVPIIKLSEEN